MQPASVPASSAEALPMLNAALSHLSATDWAAVSARVQGDVLAGRNNYPDLKVTGDPAAAATATAARVVF